MGDLWRNWVGELRNPDIKLEETDMSDLSQNIFILFQFTSVKRNATIFKYVCDIEPVDGKQN